MNYIGRFAPSPTGPLHFGSLVAALASFLDARAQGGQWLLRMENIDPPREQVGAAESILHSLEVHQLHWDGTVLYQSTRSKAYQTALQTLAQQGLSFRCACGRQELQGAAVYNGHCRTLQLGPETFSSIRLNINTALERLSLPPLIQFEDLVQGRQQQNVCSEVGDFIIHRKDGLFAYQLAVVVDDLYQGITHVIRGMDLLDSTSRQILLFKLLGHSVPQFGHIPVALNELGQKLSKQHMAPPLNDSAASANLVAALHFLKQNPPSNLKQASVADIISWGIQHWQLSALRAFQ